MYFEGNCVEESCCFFIYPFPHFSWRFIGAAGVAEQAPGEAGKPNSSVVFSICWRFGAVELSRESLLVKRWVAKASNSFLGFSQEQHQLFNEVSWR